MAEAKKSAEVVSEKEVASKAETNTAVETNVKNSDKKAKKTKPKEKRKSKVGSMLKETGSELKKVTWPQFSKVVSQTGVVLAVVLFFTAILFAIDRVLAWLLSLIV